MKNNELTYWTALAHMPWEHGNQKKKMELYCECFKKGYSIIDLFERPDVRKEIGVFPQEEAYFMAVHEQLPNYAFMLEDLQNQGFHVIPVTSPEYPQALKKNLGKDAPFIIYVKGDKTLLNEESTAIVGSRNANQRSLEFTDNIARKATRENKVVVSGFARGVDRRALDATVEAGGRSIIVLPQGIASFRPPKMYHKGIRDRKIAIISYFHPNAGWIVGNAMDRNKVIYGLAKEIYAAQSDDHGGTWDGVNKGLKNKQDVKVRIPEPREKNANWILIKKGAKAVDFEGNEVDVSNRELSVLDLAQSYAAEPEVALQSATTEPQETESPKNDLQSRILELLTGRELSTNKIIEALGIDMSADAMRKLLRSMSDSIEEQKKSGRIYFNKKQERPNLFDL